MKKIIIIILATFSLFSCRKSEVDILLGNPENRITDSIQKVNTILLSAKEGWIAKLNTGSAGGFGFYMNFKDDGSLEMLMDGNDFLAAKHASAKTFGKSTFRVKHVMNITLLFDTYNYITLLQDPVGSVANGEAGKGLKSDVEFEVLRSFPDSVILRGKKYLNSLILVPATAAQKQAYTAGEFPTTIQNALAFFDPIKSAYFNIDIKGKQQAVQVGLNFATKKLDLTTLDQEKEALSFLQLPFAFSIDAIQIIDPLAFAGYTFEKIKIQDGAYFIVDNKGGEYPLIRSDEQIIPIRYSIGESISELVLPGPYSFASRLPLASWSADYTKEWRSFISQAASSYSLTIANAAYVFDKVNSRINVEMQMYQNNGRFLANMQYNYSFDTNSNLKFSAFSSLNSNANLLVPFLNNSIHKRMLSDTFSLGYDVDPNFGKLVKFTSIEHPEFYFTLIIN